jgi:hypothetical protein
MATQESTALVKQENIQAIVQSAPKAYETGKISHDKCLEFGNALLKKIEENGGLNDELDAQVADYLVRVGTTLKKINDTRTPVTRLFDDIKKVFTALENDIDKTKTGTLPFRLQALRNAYAKQKFEAAERLRKEEEERQRIIAVKNNYIQSVKDDYRRLVSEAINNSCKTLMELDKNVTLENYQRTYDFIDDFQTELPLEWYKNLKHTIKNPTNIPINIDELKQIEIDVKKELYKEFSEQYLYEIESTKVYVQERLPSKKMNLEKIAKYSPEEAALIKEAMETNNVKEAAKMEDERKARELEQQQKAEAAQQMNEMNSLFAMAEAAQPVAKTSVKVSKKINIVNANGIVPIINMWFTREGVNLELEELCKIFKKQITFCEKLAKEDVFIEDKNIIYVDDVKAK